jgi:hypothetical protein
MKRFPLLPLFALVFAVAYACSDSTAPATSRALLAPKNPVGFFGDPPPPPVDVAMTININSPGSAVFTGVYFSNGKICDDGSCSEPTFDGTAWLRLDNKQPTPNGTASPNTRFMVKDVSPPTGMGTLTFGAEVFKIVRVDTFTPSNFCGPAAPGFPPSSASPCASITFTAEVVGGVPCDLNSPDDPNCHHGSLQAFDKATCLVPDGEGGFTLICGNFLD